MKLRDGRNQVHDYGPRPDPRYNASNLRPIVSYSDKPAKWTGTSLAAMFAEGKVKREYKQGLPPQRTLTCVSCGGTATRYYVAQYCSDRCRNREAQRARRARKKEAKLRP